MREFLGGLVVRSAEDTGLIFGQGTEIPYAVWCGQNK